MIAMSFPFLYSLHFVGCPDLWNDTIDNAWIYLVSSAQWEWITELGFLGWHDNVFFFCDRQLVFHVHACFSLLLSISFSLSSVPPSQRRLLISIIFWTDISHLGCDGSFQSIWYDVVGSQCAQCQSGTRAQRSSAKVGCWLKTSPFLMQKCTITISLENNSVFNKKEKEDHSGLSTNVPIKL